jgi:hypothetical protein
MEIWNSPGLAHSLELHTQQQQTQKAGIKAAVTACQPIILHSFL